MSAVPADVDARLTREQTAAALTEAGFPIQAGTLATKATRGGGPPYQLFGTRVLYRWADALKWAEGRLSAPRASTSEHDCARPRPAVTGNPSQDYSVLARDQFSILGAGKRCQACVEPIGTTGGKSPGPA
jgi:hypothetical protein